MSHLSRFLKENTSKPVSGLANQLKHTPTKTSLNHQRPSLACQPYPCSKAPPSAFCLGIYPNAAIQLRRCTAQVAAFLSELIDEVQNNAPRWVSQPLLVRFFQFQLEFITLPARTQEISAPAVPAPPKCYRKRTSTT